MVVKWGAEWTDLNKCFCEHVPDDSPTNSMYHFSTFRHNFLIVAQILSHTQTCLWDSFHSLLHLWTLSSLPILLALLIMSDLRFIPWKVAINLIKNMGGYSHKTCATLTLVGISSRQVIIVVHEGLEIGEIDGLSSPLGRVLYLSTTWMLVSRDEVCNKMGGWFLHVNEMNVYCLQQYHQVAGR